MRILAWSTGLFMVFNSWIAGADAGIQVAAVPGSVRVGIEGSISGADRVDLACARGEYESVQVVVTAVGGNLSGVEAEVSALQDAAGAVLTPENVRLYRVEYVPVRHSAPRAACPPGMVADPLVPFVNPYTGEPAGAPRWRGDALEGPRFGGAPFDVWQDRHQPLWLEVFAPRDAVPGVYSGVFTVKADAVPAVEMSIQVTVWPFTLPEGPAHENHFGGFERVAAYHGLKADSEQYYVLEDRYAAMMAEHRLNPPVPRRLRPAPAEDGSIVFDTELDRQFEEFVNRHHVTNVEVPRAPFGDILGADRPRALNFYRSWYAYLESKGWAKGAYLYMLDEPNDPEAYERVRQLGGLVREAEPRLRRLVVEQPYTQNPEWGALDGAIDIWCPLFGFVHEPSVQRVQANGDEVWSYTALVQTAPPYHPEYESVKTELPPFWQIDFPWLSYRIAPWLNRRYGITGLLYWSTVYWGSPDRNPWDDPGFRVRWNGDGFLFYPGADAGIEGPIASIRLKNLRDGMEDYEYFVLLEQFGGREAVEAIVREAVPDWGHWDQDSGRLLERRRRLAQEILDRMPAINADLP